MNTYRIREAKSSDRNSIATLWLELMDHHRALDSRFRIAPDAEHRYSRHAQEMIRSNRARVLIAEEVDTSKVFGYIMGELQDRPAISIPGLYGFISDVYIRESWREQGVARALVDELKQWFIKHKATAVELYAAENNIPSLAFWENMGMKPFLKLMHLEL